MHKIFNCGLIDELIAKKLFVNSVIKKKSDNELIIKHDTVEIIYPKEWSLEMIKDAAILVLKINKIANRYGFKLIDCHPNNITFVETKPLYLDLGSFAVSQKKLKHTDLVSPFFEFTISYLMPLKIIKKIGFDCGKLFLPSYGRFIKPSLYFKMIYPPTRLLGSTFIDQFISKENWDKLIYKIYLF